MPQGALRTELPSITSRPKTPVWDSYQASTSAAVSLPAVTPRGLPQPGKSAKKEAPSSGRESSVLIVAWPFEEDPIAPPRPWRMDAELALLDRQPRLRDQKPVWWKSAPQRVTGIASQFDERHMEHSRKAIRDLDNMALDPTSERSERSFWKHMLEVKANRYNVQPLRQRALMLSPRGHLSKHQFRLAGARGGPWLAPEPYQPEGRVEEAEVMKPPWSLEKSIWGPRKANSDSRDYYDSETLEEEIVRSDWAMIVGEEGAFILRHDGPSDDEDDDETDGNQRSPAAHGDDEVEEVLKVLLEFKRPLLNLYNYWAGSTTTPAMASSLTSDSWLTISWGAYLSFVDDHGIVDESSKYCQDCHVAILFESLNADDGRQKKSNTVEAAGTGKGKGKCVILANQNKVEDKKSLDRREYFQSLVRLSVMKYVKSGIERDVSSSVRRLVTECLIAKASAESLADANDFREDSCYYEEIDDVLQANVSGLNALYSKYAKLTGANLSGYSSNNSMELPEWLDLLSHKQMFEDESTGITFKQGVLIFIRSRMRCRDDGLSSVTKTMTKAALKSRTMFFCDFCEALVRVASVMEAIPESNGANWPRAGQEKYLERRLVLLLAHLLDP